VWKIAVPAVLALAATGAYAEIRSHEESRPVASTAIRPGIAAFTPAPIPASWVVSGEPVTESAEVSQTQDGSTQVYLWRTTASTFRWTHRADEIITILSGDVYITDADGKRHHLTPGDVAHFPVGSTQVWEVPKSLLKSAILKYPSPQVVEAPMRWLRRARTLVAG
jgi:uncharacterized protein